MPGYGLGQAHGPSDARGNGAGGGANASDGRLARLVGSMALMAAGGAIIGALACPQRRGAAALRGALINSAVGVGIALLAGKQAGGAGA